MIPRFIDIPFDHPNGLEKYLYDHVLEFKNLTAITLEGSSYSYSTTMGIDNLGPFKNYTLNISGSKERKNIQFSLNFSIIGGTIRLNEVEERIEKDDSYLHIESAIQEDYHLFWFSYMVEFNGLSTDKHKTISADSRSDGERKCEFIKSISKFDKKKSMDIATAIIR